jgi:hypothetical protein
VGALENATRSPKAHHADALDEALATNGELRKLWAEISDSSGAPSWYRDVLALERRSRDIEEYHSILIPGLLQIPGYARTLIHARQVGVPTERIEQAVKARCARLTALPGVRLWFVVDEVVINRIVGDETIMAEQLQHVMDLAKTGTIRFQVIPGTLRRHPGLCSPFRIFDTANDGMVVRMDHTYGGSTYRDAEQVSYMRSLFGALQAEALSPSQTEDLMARTVEGLR